MGRCICLIPYRSGVSRLLVHSRFISYLVVFDSIHPRLIRLPFILISGTSIAIAHLPEGAHSRSVCTPRALPNSNIYNFNTTFSERPGFRCVCQRRTHSKLMRPQFQRARQPVVCSYAGELAECSLCAGSAMTKVSVVSAVQLNCILAHRYSNE